MTKLYHIQQGIRLEEANLKEKVGVIGYSMMELAALNIPVAPGFVIDISSNGVAPSTGLTQALDEGISKLEETTGRRFSDSSAPLLLRVCLSPSMNAESVPTVEYVGMNSPTALTLAGFLDAQNVYLAFQAFLESYAELCKGISRTEIDKAKTFASEDDPKSICNNLISRLLADFDQNPVQHLETAILELSKSYHSDPLNQDIPASIVVQYIPCGDANSPLLVGEFLTRDIKNGDPHLNGFFSPGCFFREQQEKQDLDQLDPQYLDIFDEIAGTLEGYYLDVRQVDFQIEHGKAYVFREQSVRQKSIATKLRILSDMKAENQITDEEYVTSISAKELNSLLFSTINAESVSGLKVVRGGIAGSLGATSGKVYFSTQKLMEAYWTAKAEDAPDIKLILLQKSTFAEDVQAVEIGCGVITSDGGYTSHAPIVARSLGKPAIVYPEIDYHDDHVMISGLRIDEGDFISMEILSAEEPAIYLGKAELEYPDIEQNGVKNLLDCAKSFAMGIKILANADTPDEASQAKYLGADGIGLCRTEHMFLRNKRIYAFRDLLITKNRERKKEILNQIKSFLTEDFKALFEIMDGKPITIRLLDAPLHEFLPTDDAELETTMRELPALAAEQSKEEIRQSFLRLKETNPMLGHRGCRVGISSPEIYDVQTMAILEAAYLVKSEKEIDVQPAIMIPLIMSLEEMYLLKNGQIMEGKESFLGIIGNIRQFMKTHQLERQPFKVRIGAMIELPAAAISASDIAKQAEFFSFGTNDLTQTTMGLSRDDINSFLPTYTEMDVWKSDPFQNLLPPVKALIDQAILTGRQVRPDLATGICGEHGANPEVIEYCLQVGMNYISCSPFGIPIAILAVAQSNLKNSQ